MPKKIDYRIKLIADVNSYNNYDARVIENLTKQINSQKKIDKKIYEDTVSKLPQISSNLEKYYQKIDQVTRLTKEFKKDTKDPSKNRLILTDGRVLTVGGAKTKSKAIENIVLRKN